MDITRWAPFSAFTSLEREMQSLLDRFGTRPFTEGFGWRPSTDVMREDDALIVRAELPGIDPETDLSIEVESNVLRISGEKKVESEIEDRDRYVKECRYGHFHREIMLPEGIDSKAVTAAFDNGVLTVKVPLPAGIAGSEKTKVPISVGEKLAV